MTINPTPTISAAGKASLDQFLDETVDAGVLPAMFFGAANKDGLIYFNCKGDVVAGQPDKGQVDEDTVLQLFSMTKLFTSIACLQLAEQGKVSFDDGALIEQHLPELCAMPILEGYDADGKEILKERKTPITLRHLLTHTAGLAYNFTRPEQMRWEMEHKHRSWFAPNADVPAFATPLAFEPGTRYMYGTGIDWAGILVWRVSGQTLEEYFQEHIFGPCGVTGITFYPNEHVQKHLMHVSGRDPKTGKLVPSTGLRNVAGLTPSDIGVLAGGAGLLGTAKDHLTVLSKILACKDADGVVSQRVFAQMFESALPPRDTPGQTVYTDLGRFLGILGDTTPDHVSGEAVSHSLALCIGSTPTAEGRNAGSGWWGGAAQTKYWFDPAAGIVGWAGTQLMEPEDPSKMMDMVRAYEAKLYKALQ